MSARIFVVLLLSIGICSSCSQEKNQIVKDGTYTDGTTTLFTKITSAQSNIPFKNMVREDMEFNFLNYPYLYTGAGVAIGDIDKDGFEDVYLTSNFGHNKLYKNNGDFTFEDITSQSKILEYEGFTTGATMLDVNNDGWLDIYVSKAGSLNSDDGRRNKLFVNQKDGTFKEEAAKWGIDDPGYTTQVYSIDYDKDGDLDLYVLNYRYDFRNNTKISGAIQKAIEETTSDQLYRNDGSRFTKVTGEAGIYNKSWGLSGAVGDFNNDGWDDIYISNDYLEPDLMYINQRDGTFKNEANTRVNHISFNSMGSDYADLNNDNFPDLVTVDMLAENYARSKENMAAMSTEDFNALVNIGYHHAYMANMLHYNNGNGKYKETAQLSGIVKTDWSWAPLLADFDNDGYKDIFITNGVYKDYNNQDFRRELKARNARGESMTLQAVLDLMPSQKLDNYVYKNNGDLSFTKKIKEWGLEDPGFSNGAAYADFDNDGDLDLIVNNVNSEIGLYRNNANVNAVKIKLEGSQTNTLALGAEVTVNTGDETQYQRFFITRGFQSSVSPLLYFGLGGQEKADVTVRWPDGKVSNLKQVDANTTVTLAYKDATEENPSLRSYTSSKQYINPQSIGIDYTHQENAFNDYDTQLLLPQKQSTKGTGLTTGDVNNDGLDDFFVGNALGAAAALYVQQTGGTFVKTNEALWQREAGYEDANALFFDADQDGDEDLYVTSAGYELKKDDSRLQDRLYLNDGNGNFTNVSAQKLPEIRTSTKAIAAADYDNDGDIDLFVGGNVIPGQYPMSPESHLLENNNGHFMKVTNTHPDLNRIGMVSDALFSDYDGDKDLDLLVVGEWMQPTFFENKDGAFAQATTTGLDKTEGWWFSITAADFDQDGKEDYVLGNLGKNNKFQPNTKKPLSIHAKDFDANGSFDVALSKIAEGKAVPIRGRECSSEQNPYLLDKIGSYKEFASLEFKDIYGEDKLKDAFQLKAYQFESVILHNLGNGQFEIMVLPNEAQTGPTLALTTNDINGDGHLDIIGIGAIYDAEVETIRYDGNYGYVLLGDGQGNFTYSINHDPFIDRDAKDIAQIAVNNTPYYLVVSNNAPLEVFTFLP